MKYQLENCFVNISNNNEYLQAIQNSLSGKNKVTFFYLNSYSFYLANKNKDFRKAFNKADYIIADGYSVVWLIKNLYKVNTEKVVFTYSFFDNLSKLFSDRNIKIYLLGSTQKVIEKSAEILRKKYELNIVGFSNGFFESEINSEKLITEINSDPPEIIIVGMGMPKSEIWIQNNINNINAKVIFSVGGFFDFLTEKNKMAPRWFYNSGLEWIYRLMQEPFRLCNRYWFSNTFLLKFVIKKIFSNKRK